MIHAIETTTLLASIMTLAACAERPATASATPSRPAQQFTSTVAPDVDTMCRQALGTAAVASAGPLTTVGDVRSLTIGPGFTPATGAFPDLLPTAAASYCWTGHSEAFTSFAVTLDGRKIKLAGIHGMAAAPTGPPVIP